MFDVLFPTEPGKYTFSAELTDATGARVRSLRDVTIVGAK
jgi:hypothetical protein